MKHTAEKLAEAWHLLFRMPTRCMYCTITTCVCAGAAAWNTSYDSDPMLDGCCHNPKPCSCNFNTAANSRTQKQTLEDTEANTRLHNEHPAAHAKVCCKCASVQLHCLADLSVVQLLLTNNEQHHHQHTTSIRRGCCQSSPTITIHTTTNVPSTPPSRG
jgi:hypothetical protein